MSPAGPGTTCSAGARVDTFSAPGISYGSMLTLDLARLHREKHLPVEASIPSEADLWQGSELRFDGPVEVKGTASLTAEGGVVVRGQWTASLAYECGRCLDPITHPMERELTLVYMPSEGWEADDPDVRVMGYNARTLELSDAVREEVLLEAPRYLLPPENEDGRCQLCDRPTETFGHEPEDEAGDPRWSKLRALDRE